MEHVNLARGVDFQPETAPVTGPFVVNLCTSVAPIDLKTGSLPGLERYRLYQVRRVEDSRARYRLRLGFFADETATEAVLAAVRQHYPAAFCVPAGSDDLKHAPGFDPTTLATEATGRHPKPAIAAPTPVTQPRAVQTAAATPAAASTPPKATQSSASAKPNPASPAPIQKPVTVPSVAADKAASIKSVRAPDSVKAVALELLPDPVPQAAPAAAPTSGVFRVQAADPTALKAGTLELKLEADRSAADVPLIAAPQLTDAPILLDSTQTLRMLTESEIADKNAPQWFALQLAMSDRPINLETMPKLDIFAAFRLYSVATPQQGQIVHCLRLGFFRERVSAEAVAGYLKTFFTAPDVIRVSNAEQTRFADPPKPPVLQDTAPTGAKVVPLNDARVKAGKPISMAPAAKPLPAAAKAAAPAVKSAAIKSAPAKPAGKAVISAPATKKPPGKRAAIRNRSLNDLLQEEAHQVTLSESGIRRMEQKGSLISRLVGKFTR